MPNTPNPLVTDDEISLATDVMSAIVALGGDGQIGVMPATLDEDTRVLVLTVGNGRGGEVPLAIVIDTRPDHEDGLFERLTPLPADVEIQREVTEESA